MCLRDVWMQMKLWSNVERNYHIMLYITFTVETEEVKKWDKPRSWILFDSSEDSITDIFFIIN